MNKEKLESLIDLGVNAFINILNIHINGWDFITIEDYNNPLTKEIMCSYDDELDMIFINPYIIDIFEEKKLPRKLFMPELMAKIGHEFRHAWQKRDKSFEKEIEKWKSILETGTKNYMNQAIELDAAAFEEVVLMSLTNDLNIKVDLPYEKIHKQAVDMYNIYSKAIKAEFEKYDNVLHLNI